MPDPLDREARRLYGLPGAEFTAARNARAKALKADDPELAAAVAALPKPSAAAAALNALARDDPSEVRALLQCGRRLREAQEAAVAGKQADVGTAVDEHRTALERVLRDLRGRKLSAAVLERATQTLRVASVDPELQPRLERGTLHADATSSGFDLDPSLVPARARSARRATSKPRTAAKSDRPDPKRRQRLERAERALVEAERQAAAALDELEQAKAEVEAARAALDDL